MKKNMYRTIVTILMLISLAVGGSTGVWAAGDSYTMSLVPYSATAQPGEEINVAIQVTSTASGEKDIAALQANVSYDKELLEYVDYAAYDGTIALFSEEQGVVAGFGEGQTFNDKLDFMVLTFRVKDGAEGTTQLALSDPILAKTGAVELEAVTGADASITLGSAVPSAAEESAKYEPAAPSNATGGLIRGSETDESGTAATSGDGSGGANSTAASGSNGSGSGDGTGAEDSDDGSGDGAPADGTSTEEEEDSSSGGFLSGLFGGSSGDSDAEGSSSGDSSSVPVWAVILVVLAGAAAIGGCVWYFLVYKKRQ